MSAPQPVAVDARWQVHLGDCVAWLLSLPEASVDAIVCDPPYGLSPDGRARTWDDVAEGRARGGFMGRAWDAACPGRTWAEACLRALKPGGHLVAFGATRTVHRLACAVEDVGFELRDSIGWVYYSGFPKSLDVSKAIDAVAGADREVVGLSPHAANRTADMGYGGGVAGEGPRLLTAPATDDARRWAGWGTALKPALEPAVLARKPLVGTVAANILGHGTGALHIDACRLAPGDVAWVGPDDGEAPTQHGGRPSGVSSGTGAEIYGLRGAMPPGQSDGQRLGRFPANLYYCPKAPRLERERGCDDLPARSGAEAVDREEGSAGTHSPRAGAGRTAEKVRNHHPTVKPVRLMRWLCRLVTPPGGLVVDPFTGSGTTGAAAMLEGLRFMGAEMEPDYHAIATARIAHAARWPASWADTTPGADVAPDEAVEVAEKAGQMGLFGGRK